jgi:hypothetical protein
MGAGEQTAAGFVDLASVAGALAGDMPDVQPHAIEQARRDADETQAVAASAPVDDKGTRFDPALHSVDAAGNPVKTAKGTWSLKRGRKGGVGSTLATGAKSTPGASSANVAQASDDALARAAGTQAAELVFLAGMIVGGEEWAPRTDHKVGLDERAMMQQAMANYFAATGKKDIPPGMALSLAIVAYAMPRLGMPKTRTRVAGLKDWLASKWLAWRARRGLKGQTANASETPAKG